MSENSATIQIHPTDSRITFANRWDHWLVRWGIHRQGHRVEPGLYALGQPGPGAPVFVTGNYTLSFDALRSALAGVDAYLLILDTVGINVWCAAGKGTFGTDELVKRIEAVGLTQVVEHRRLILPQLGAPGVSAHEVKQRSGFTVSYGPVRAADLPEYLRLGQATPEMRRVRFPLRDRLVLVPVELVFILPWMALSLLLGWYSLAAALLAGTVLFPILLPWLPTPNFSTKGLVLGGLIAAPFVIETLLRSPQITLLNAGLALSKLLGTTALTAFLALNFTGSTSFTSRSGVRREIFRYLPAMAWSFGASLVLSLVLSFFKNGG